MAGMSTSGLRGTLLVTVTAGGAWLAFRALAVPQDVPQDMPKQPSPATETPASGALQDGGAPCPSGMLPDYGICIPVPARAEGPTDSIGAIIGLLPGRPEDRSRYVSPIAGRAASSGPDAATLFITAAPGTAVKALALEGQSGSTRRAATSAGARLLTLHEVRRPGSRSYILIHEGLTFTAPAVWEDVAPGAVLGHVSAGSSSTGLRLTTRQLRRGVDATRVTLERLLRDSHSIPCDARNVLPLEP